MRLGRLTKGSEFSGLLGTIVQELEDERVCVELDDEDKQISVKRGKLDFLWQTPKYGMGSEKSAAPKEMFTCAGCGTMLQKKPDKCSKCLAVVYCGAECQRKHWEMHKKECERDCPLCFRPFGSRPVTPWPCCGRKICNECVDANFSCMPYSCLACRKKAEKGTAERHFADATALMGKAKEVGGDEIPLPAAAAAIYEKVVKAFREALRLKPTLRFARCNLGVVLFTLGRFEEAGVELRRAIKQDAEDAKARYVMGSICALVQNRDDALEYLEQAVSLVEERGSDAVVYADYTAMLHSVEEGAFDREPRFQLGCRVECSCDGGWKRGKVVDHWYRETDWPPEKPSAPYQIELDRGQLIFAAYDDDRQIRRAAR